MCGKRVINPEIVGLQNGAPTMKTFWRFITKLEINLPHDLNISLLGIHSKNFMSSYNDIDSPTLNNDLLTIATTLKYPSCL